MPTVLACTKFGATANTPQPQQITPVVLVLTSLVVTPRLCKNGEWQFVRLDDYFPCFPEGGPVYSKVHPKQASKQLEW